MSYRVDIPTLSANEVYTLTFEYEGTETIQLIVGDLTLETTDRRVVFTTTSPVNYIESNVNLTNLNMYEGYYESDDFGGEYTQESYIEGKSLVNLYDPNIHYKQTNTNGLSFGNSSYFQKTITEDGFINFKVLNADVINSSNSTWQQLRTYSTMSQGNTDVFTVILFLRKNNVKTTGLVVKFGYGHKDYNVTEIVKGDIDTLSGSIDIPTGQTGIYHAVIKRGGHSSIVDTDYYSNAMEVGFDGDWQNGELEYSWVVLEGDHHDEFVNGEINYFTSVGCVKSPKIVSRNEDGTEESIITTPDDLELYSGYDSNGNWYGDKLDLTTGTFYQYYDMWDLATLLSQNGPLTNFGYNSDTNTVYVQYDIGSTHPSGTVWGGQGGYSALIGNYFEYGYGNATYGKKTSPYVGFFNKYLYLGGMSYDEIFNGVTIINNGSALNRNEAVSALIQFVTDNNLKIGLPLNTPTTEQLSLNTLKSYRNGSIQTSSQQLAPTLKTTLPVSNKFTTTNLTSGSTYNVYFDGTATKLDAGGTIITNPVSPCEVECGGTTLTIEGTDIQNVRVIETTVKNEVGNNGTSDVELSSIENLDVNGENIIISKLEQPIKLRSLGTTYDSYNPVTGELIKRIGVSETDGSYSVLSSPIISQVEIDNIPHLYTNGQVKVYSDSDVYPTTILNGQSTNNYEINELNTSNNYTIRYEGECESISLANKSNTQGNNVLVKAGATSGNLTFVNDNGYINNVLLTQNDVREQEINYFNGLETVEVSRMLIENQRNMSSQHYTIEDGSHYNYQRILPHYIKVEPNETLYANIGQNWVDWCSIYQYDEDKNRLSDIGVFGGYGTTQFKDSDGLYKNIITLSDNTHYIRIVLHNAFTSTFTLSRGDFLPPSTLAHNQYQGQYIDLPQPVQLNSLPDGTCDTYNPITGEYVQNVGYTDSTNYDTYYQLVNPTITQLTPITIPTFEGGIVQLITTDGKVFPMVEYSMPTNNRYDTSTWEAGAVYTQRNMTEAYFNESTTPMTPTETMTLTTDHISSGSIILNDNGNGLIVLKGNYTGRDIPYFTGMRSVEAIEVETTPSPDQPLFGKGGRK